MIKRFKSPVAELQVLVLGIKIGLCDLLSVAKPPITSLRIGTVSSGISKVIYLDLDFPKLDILPQAISDYREVMNPYNGD